MLAEPVSPTSRPVGSELATVSSANSCHHGTRPEFLLNFQGVPCRRDGTTCGLREGDRVALAGPAGCGKSRLLQAVLGELHGQGDTIFAPTVKRLGVLRRGFTAALEDVRSTREAELLALVGPRTRGNVLSPVCVVDVNGVARNEEDVQVEARWRDLVSPLLDGGSAEAQTHWVRLAVAMLVFLQPQVLILDDPTEGLDNAAAEELEHLLLAVDVWRAWLFSSRDRDFMDKTCTRVLEMDGDAAQWHVGNYTRYLSSKEWLRFHSFSLWMPRSAGLRATQAACAFAALAARRMRPRPSLNLVDVGTGTGLLSLIVAQEWERAMKDVTELSVQAVDLDGPAVSIAARNFAASPWAAQLHVEHAALQTWCPQRHADMVLCNPPYSAKVVTQKRAGTEEEQLSRRHALERDFLPLDVLCASALRIGASELWILWDGVDDTPVVAAARGSGWRPVRIVRFQRNPRTAPFAAAWLLLLEPSQEELETETLLWYDEEGAPTSNWFDLVGSLYYWRLRRCRPEHFDGASRQSVQH